LTGFGQILNERNRLFRQLISSTEWIISGSARGVYLFFEVGLKQHEAVRVFTLIHKENDFDLPSLSYRQHQVAHEGTDSSNGSVSRNEKPRLGKGVVSWSTHPQFPAFN